MRFEGITLAAIVAEIAEEARGGRVQNVYQPLDEAVLLELYTGQKRQLLIAAGPEARIHFTEQSFPNPPEPPAFCMLLRKHLRNGFVHEIQQPGLERIVDIVVARGEERTTLRAELMRPNGNVLLLDGDEVLGAQNASSGHRSFEPHSAYVPPEGQGKLDPRGISQTAFGEALSANSGEPTKRALFKALDGIGPLTAGELAVSADVDPSAELGSLSDEEIERLWGVTRDRFGRLEQGDLAPHVYVDADGTAQEATPWPYASLSDHEANPVATMSEAIDACYRTRRETPVERRWRELQRALTDEINHVEKSLANVTEDLQKAERYEADKTIGDLLMAYLASVPRGESSVELTDFEGQVREVSLDPTLEPVENAQSYYQRYKKRKRGVEKLQARQRQLRWERSYLRGLQVHLDEAETLADLDALEAELVEAGAIQQPTRSPKRQSAPSGPRRVAMEGHQIYVGRNGRQNDQLIRDAHPDDLWLHAKDRPGSHVVIKSDSKGDVPDEVLQRAAELAAYHSKGRDAGKVEVTYTLIKHLKKPKGARPGLVVVNEERGTLTVEPRGEADGAS
ncbi:MAG: NFACT family protein [Candidatus Bipolaricaulia bacterium]